MSVLPILTKILCVLPVLNLKANVVPLIPTSNLKGEGSCVLSGQDRKVLHRDHS